MSDMHWREVGDDSWRLLRAARPVGYVHRSLSQWRAGVFVGGKPTAGSLHATFEAAKAAVEERTR